MMICLPIIVSCDHKYKATIPSLQVKAEPYLLEDAPVFLSLGRLVIDDTFDFYWLGSKNKLPVCMLRLTSW